MKSEFINQKLKDLQKKKNRLIDVIKSEQETLEYLVNNDITWYFFAKNVLNRRIVDFSKFGYSKSEWDNLIRRLHNIKVSNGTKYYKKGGITIGAVCDQQFFRTFKDTVNLKVIVKGYKLNDLEECDVLIITNLNHKLYGGWDTFNSEESKLLSILNLINKFKSLNKPVIFFDNYIDDNHYNLIIANEVDQIFTTNNRKYEFYLREKSLNVNKVTYSVNPLLHNPVDMFSKINGVLYQGSLNKYKNTLETIFEGVLNATRELKIIDLNSYNENIHKLYVYSVVVGDIEKVYQLQALGNVILTFYDPEINNKFPNVFTVDNHYEIKRLLDSHKEKDIMRIQLQGIRNIMSNHLCYENMQNILKSVGINFYIQPKTVLVVGENDDSKKQFFFQSYKYKEYIERNKLTSDILKNFDFVAFLSPDYIYEEYYIEDLINGFKYTNSDFVSKIDSSKNNKPFTYSNFIIDFYKTMFYIDSFDPVELINKKINTEKNYSGFYIDDLGVKNVKECYKTNIETKYKKQISVVIPIYNNGEFLEYKCFESLKRSSIFNSMEIIFVDDGSTDLKTRAIVDRLNRDYENVVVYKFNDRGSGSASRPRNKGIELSTCEYITFLDPDNEAINDGYAQLLNEITKDDELDLVVGNIIRYDKSNEQKEINYYRTIHKINNSDIVDQPMAILKKSNLKVQSIQALVVKKETIVRNNLKMVEGAAGQDTLFFQELLTKAKKMKIVDIPIHIYYAAVDNSVTNSINSKFYEKYYRLEIERMKFLKNNGLLDLYIKNKFQFYFINWYLKKLVLIQKGEEKDALLILNNIYKMYESYIDDHHDMLKIFNKYMKKNKYNEFIQYCKEYFID